jgi:hypothetical protein
MAEANFGIFGDDFSLQGTTPANALNSISDSSIPGGDGGSGAGAGRGAGSVLAFDPYTSPYIEQRRVFFTINTYTNLSRTDIIAKAYLNGVEIEEQSNSKGRIVFSLNEQRLLNPSTLTLVSGDLKPLKYFIIQARKDIENEVSIIEYEEDSTSTTTSPSNAESGVGIVNSGVTGTTVIGGGASGFGAGGGGMLEVNPLEFRGAGFGLANASRNERPEAQQ